MFAQVNIVAVVIAAVASMAIGAFWYSYAGFGKTWLKLIGKTEKDLEPQKKELGKYYALTMVGALVLAYVLALFIDLAGSYDPTSGAVTGFWAWLGFVVTTTLGDHLFAGRPQKLYFLNNGYHLISMMVMGAIIGQFS